MWWFAGAVPSAGPGNNVRLFFIVEAFAATRHISVPLITMELKTYTLCHCKWTISCIKKEVIF